MHYYLVAGEGAPNKGEVVTAVKYRELSDNDLEWILNSLRAMQETQQKLAGEFQGKTFGADDILRTKGKEFVLGDEAPGINMSEEVFIPQMLEVTELREDIVEFVGRDLTDG